MFGRQTQRRFSFLAPHVHNRRSEAHAPKREVNDMHPYLMDIPLSNVDNDEVVIDHYDECKSTVATNLNYHRDSIPLLGDVSV